MQVRRSEGVIARAEKHARRDLPTGTVTFLFTDIEGSTTLLQQLGDAEYSQVQAEHRRLLRSAFAAAEGREVDTQGDAFFYSFPNPRSAIAAVVSAQRAIHDHPWPEGIALRVRMGLHTGEAILGPEGYVGLDVVRGARIMASGHGGQVLLTDATANLVSEALPVGVTLRDLGEHRIKDLAQGEHVLQLVIVGLPADFPALKSLGLHHNLPTLLTSFIGRELEMTHVKQLLATSPLVTLTGSGGSGKTRLALEVAHSVLKDYPAGAWLVELASLVDPALVTQTVASTLGAREVAGRPLRETLVDYVRTKRMLLVLDNCEHLVAACAELAAHLLEHATNLRILATSREPLAIQGEVTYRVPSLAVPDPKRRPPVEELRNYEAVRLFAERAVTSQPRFAVTQANALAVARIVQRVDGIPLAIELAAARVKVLSVEQIAQRLDDCFRLLTGGARTALPRQQTLRAAIDWSYGLLTDPERALLRRASIFAGGFTLEAAETICAGRGVEDYEILDLLGALVDKSLVVADMGDGDARYRMLETIRQYGRDRLIERQEDAAVREAHVRWYTALAEQAEPRLRGPEQMAWLERLEREHDNLRAALGSSFNGGHAEVGLRLGGALHRFWEMHGYLSEGRDWLEGALAQSHNVPPSVRARALYGAGLLALHQGDFDRAHACCEEALIFLPAGDKDGAALAKTLLGTIARNHGEYALAKALFEESSSLAREAGSRWTLAAALTQLGVVVRSQGDYPLARDLFEASSFLWREVGDRWGLATSVTALGVTMASQGDYARANVLHEEALALRREMGDTLNISGSLHYLGNVALNLGDYERARELFEESLALRRELGDKPNVAASLGNLAIVAYYQEDYARAANLLEESLALWRQFDGRPGMATAFTVLGRVVLAQGKNDRAAELFTEGLRLYEKQGDRRGIAWCLEGLARAAVAHGHGARAARLFGAAEALREVIGDPLPPRDRPDYDRGLDGLRRLLAEGDLSAAWVMGREMPLQAAVAEGLAAEPSASGPR